MKKYYYKSLTFKLLKRGPRVPLLNLEGGCHTLSLVHLPSHQTSITK